MGSWYAVGSAASVVLSSELFDVASSSIFGMARWIFASHDLTDHLDLPQTYLFGLLSADLALASTSGCF